MSKIMVKCRCCGAELFFAEDETTRRCGFCRTINARPESRGEGLNILNRATEQRLAQDFFHAEESYRRVLELETDSHEARWGLVLCKYGVDYVCDPRSGKQMPVCHTVRVKPMREDADFKKAVAMAPEEVRAGYEADAAYIDAAQQRIRELQVNEPGYDIFLCYKETALTSNDPTEESRVARRLYNDLTRKGYRVFYAPESLATLVGENYEAGIYHAIETARVMLVIATRPDHLMSAWVHSEWSRFLERIDSGEEKHLVPVYSGMRAEDLPVAFANRSLQALCMDELTWQDKMESALVSWLRPAKPQEPARAEKATARDKFFENAATYIRLGNLAKANEYYQMAVRDYPEDYRGWWGQIICATEQLNKAAADQAEIDTWFRYARQTADDEGMAQIEPLYRKYLLILAKRDAQAELDELRTQKQTLTNLLENARHELSQLPARKRGFRKQCNREITANKRSICIARIVNLVVFILCVAAVVVPGAFTRYFYLETKRVTDSVSFVAAGVLMVLAGIITVSTVCSCPIFLFMRMKSAWGKIKSSKTSIKNAKNRYKEQCKELAGEEKRLKNMKDEERAAEKVNVQFAQMTRNFDGLVRQHHERWCQASGIGRTKA